MIDFAEHMSYQSHTDRHILIANMRTQKLNEAYDNIMLQIILKQFHVRTVGHGNT